jgi:HD-like signal output (HDOD) protein
VAGGELITAAERALFDLDHTEVGSALAAHWKLPDEIVQAIRFHHEPSNGDSLLAHAVAVADVLSHRVVGDQADVENEDEHDDQLDLSAHLLGLDLDQMETKILERLDRAGLLPTSYEEA